MTLTNITMPHCGGVQGVYGWCTHNTPLPYTIQEAQ